MSEYVPKLDVWITQMHMPMRIRGFCKRINGDDCAVINEDLSDADKAETVEHEVRHLRRGDIDSEKRASELEK